MIFGDDGPVEMPLEASISSDEIWLERLPAASRPGKRSRSRSIGRARKRALGTLTSLSASMDDAMSGAPAMVPDGAGTMPWLDCDAPRGKSLMKYYYRLQRIVDVREWDAFEDGLHRPLPVTFRFSTNADKTYRQQGEAVLTKWFV